jgi:methionine-gamma-lyase
MNDNNLKIESICVASGHYPNQSHILPIYPTSTFVFDSAEEGEAIFNGSKSGYIYSRFHNPTSDAVLQKLEQLEGFGLPFPIKGFLCSSGMAAFTTLFLGLLKSGDKILSHYSLYGGTEEMFNRILPPLGIENVIVDFDNLDLVEDALKKDKSINWIHIETPANPTLTCVDIEAICKIAAIYNVKVSCDNTFATPLLQQPFKMGVDYVIHSATKYLNGHGTTVTGLLLGKDLEIINTTLKKAYRLLGTNTNPFDAWLIGNGLKTLPLRMKQHCENAKAVAHFLESHTAIAQTNYLGLANHKYHALASKQMSDYSGMISFELKDGIEKGRKFINQLKLAVKAVSLGTVDTLISHPATMTHVGIPKLEREKYGITDGFIRMSVGIEHIDDILNDLEQALR